MHKILLTLLVVIAFGLCAFAQDPTITLPKITVDESEEFDVDVRVSNFPDLITMQYTIRWDETKLQYLETTNMNLPFMNAGTFGDSSINVDIGLLPVAWVDQSLGGVSVDDETVIFTIRMKAMGNVGDVIPLIYVNSPTVAEIVDVTQNPVAAIYEEGEITLEDIVSIEKVEQAELQVFKNYPNPFEDFTYLPIELKETTNFTLTITDVSGKEIYREQHTKGSGSHQLRIDGSIFPSSGEYFYNVLTTHNQLTGKLIFVK